MDLKVTNQLGAVDDDDDDDDDGDDDDDDGVGDGGAVHQDNRCTNKIFCTLFSIMGDHFLVLDIFTKISKWNHGIGPITMNPNHVSNL